MPYSIGAMTFFKMTLIIVESMEQHALKTLKTFASIPAFTLKDFGGKSSNLYLNVFPFFNTSVN